MNSTLYWEAHFSDLFAACAKRYDQGDSQFELWFSQADQALLDHLGYTAREFFDFVEDHCRSGHQDPSAATALLVAAVRRDYFHQVQGGKSSTHRVDPATLPPKPQAVEGIVWLPRLIAKARAKLRGEMDPDTMYGCGGDRDFFQRHQIHPADLLRAVWSLGEDDAAIVAWVKARSRA